MRKVIVFLVVFGIAACCRAETIYVDVNATGANNGTSWTDAYKYLQDALTEAEPNQGIQIWVAQGTYKPDANTSNPGGTNDRTATFQLINDVAIYGGFPSGGGVWESRDPNLNETILSGDINVPDVNTDNNYHVVTGSGTDSTAILDGFTITKGNASGLKPYDHGPSSYGGGMYNSYYSSPMLINCTFRDNSAYIGGGGLYNFDNSSPVLTNCTFSDNSACMGSGMYNEVYSSPAITNCIFKCNSFLVAGCGSGLYNIHNSSPVLANCTFISNSGCGMNSELYSNPMLTNCTFSSNSGVGMNNVYMSNPILTNCTFSDNSGPGMANGFFCNPVLTNCTFIENSSDSGGGIFNVESGLALTNCIFIGNKAKDYGGGIWQYTGNSIITNCNFIGNSSDEGGGICISGESSLIITNCTFSGNSAISGGAMKQTIRCNSIITNCILWGNIAQSEAQISNDESSSVVANYCNIQGGWEGTGNIDANPLFADANGSDDIIGTEDDNVRLLPDSPCIDAGDNTAVPEEIETDLDGKSRFMDGDFNSTVVVDMGAYEFGGIIFVDANATGANNGTSWADAYKYLQDALNEAEPNQGIQIWVAQGTYRPDENNIYPDGTNDRAATFQLKNGVGIYGGYPSGGGSRDPNTYPAILNGDINVPDDNNDNSYHVVTGSNVDSTAVLDGFTISGGNGGEDDPYLVDKFGGGMYNYSGSPTINNCTFIGNSAEHGGGMYNYSGSQTINNCTFIGNSAEYGGGMHNYSGSQTINNCLFSDNSSPYGGGMYNELSNIVLTNCNFTDNSVGFGGGMWNYSGHITIINCTFSGNDGFLVGGGICNYYSEQTVINSTFNDNHSSIGGGMYTGYGSVSNIYNCTFSGNIGEHGGGMCNQGGSVTLTNCTFIGNLSSTAGGMLNGENNETAVTNCSFIGNLAYEGGSGINNAYSNPTLTNCIFSGNKLYGKAVTGGAIYNGNSNPIITNCILWGDSTPNGIGPEIYNYGTSSPIVTFSDVQGGWAGIGNIDADPLFFDANGPDGIIGTEDDNLRLLPDSPCIDAGDNNDIPGIDLDGRNRPADGDCNGVATVDMGTYEFTHAYFGDFDSDCEVDFMDYSIQAGFWFTDELLVDIAPTPAGDGVVDIYDLAVLCDNWLAGK